MRNLIYTILILLTATTAMAQSPTRGGGNNQLQSWYGGFKVIRLFNPPFTFNPWATYDSLGMVWIDSTTTKKLMWHTGVYRRYVASEAYVDSLFATAVTGVTQQTLDDSCAAIRADFPSGVGTVTSVATGYGATGGTITTTGTISVDTAAMATRSRVQKAVDSLNISIGTKGSGTVTNVATNNGTGITGGAITGTGTIAADTFLLNTRLWRNKGLDSVAALIPSVTGYVPYTGATTNVDLGTHSLTTPRVHIDTVDARSSMGVHIHSNNHTGIMTLGVGGGSNITFDGYPTTTPGDSVFTSNSSGALLRYDLKTKLSTYLQLSDTVNNVSTRSWRQKGIDSVTAIGYITPSSTNTLTNKRWTARVTSQTTVSATPSINTDNQDIWKVTAQTADITSMTTNLTGTPVDGDILEIQITGTAARAITWGASFVSSTVTLPTTTTTTATLTVILQYYSTSSYGNNKWVCVSYW